MTSGAALIRCQAEIRLSLEINTAALAGGRVLFLAAYNLTTLLPHPAPAEA
jgi:hypothetical protein